MLNNITSIKPLGWKIAWRRATFRRDLRTSCCAIGLPAFTTVITKTLPYIHPIKLGIPGSQKRGLLKRNGSIFKEKLLSFVPPPVFDSTSEFLKTKKFRPVEIEDIFEIIANTITRANGDKIKWLADWGILDRDWTTNIAKKNVESISSWASAFWKRINQLFLEYRSLELSKPQLKTIAAKALFPKLFLYELIDTYKEFPDWVVLRFVAHNPKNPESAINKAIAKKDELRKLEKYKNVPDSIILHFVAFNPKDPKSAINKVLATYNKLRKKLRKSEKYKNVSDSIILHFAVRNPEDPESAINKAIAKKGELKKLEKYKDVPDWLIFRFVVCNPRDPETAIDKALIKKGELEKLEKYKDVPSWVILHFVVYNPKETEGAIDKAIAKKDQLKELEEYKNWPDWKVFELILEKTLLE